MAPLRIFRCAILAFSSLALYTSATTSPALQVLESFVQTYSPTDLPDLKTCVGDLVDAGKNLDEAVSSFRNKRVGEAVKELGLAVHDLSVAVEPCHIEDLAARLDQVASILHIANVKWIDDTVKVVLAGVKEEELVEKIIGDWESGDYVAFGKDLSVIVTQVKDILHCGPEAKVCLVVQKVLVEAALVLPDVGPCVSKLEDLEVHLTNAVAAYDRKDLVTAVKEISALYNGLSSAMSTCHLRDLGSLFSQASKKLSLAVVTADSVKVGPIDIARLVADLVNSWKAGNYDQVGVDVNALVLILRQSGCESTQCTVLDGLLQALGIISYDMGACKADFITAEGEFTSFANKFGAGQYADALASLEGALATVSGAVHSCQLPAIGALIDLEAAKLKLGQVTVIDGVIKVIVEGADIFTALDKLYRAIASRNYDAVGAAIGDLVSVLQQTVCADPTDKTCVVVEGILETLEIFVMDLGECRFDLKVAVADMEVATTDFKNKDYKNGVVVLSQGIKALADGIKNCHLQELADVIDSQAAKLGIANVQIVEEVVHVLIASADVYEDIDSAVVAVQHGDYRTFGKAIGDLLNDSRIATCKSPICQLLSNALAMISVIAPDFSECEAELQAAWSDVESVESAIQAKDWETALKALSRVFSESSLAMKSCHLEQEAALFAQLADELGFHKFATGVEGVVQILVNGEDLLGDILSMGVAVTGKDYKTAGDALGRALQLIMKWHFTNGCDSAACYVLEGFTKALGILESDFGHCKADIEDSWAKFESAINHLKNHKGFAAAADGKRVGVHWNGLSVKASADLHPSMTPINMPPMSLAVTSRRLRAYSSWWDKVKEEFKHIVVVFEDDVKKDWDSLTSKLRKESADAEVVAALKDLASAMEDLSLSVKDCHVEQIAAIAAKLAAVLGLPAVGWIDEAFNIVIHGAQLYDDAFNVVVDYNNHNYVGMGYELAKFAIDIVRDL